MPAPPDPVPALEQQVAAAIVAELDGWAQPMAAELLRTDQPRVSELRNGKLQRFSLQRLIRFAARRGATVSLRITWPRFPFRTSRVTLPADLAQHDSPAARQP